LATVTLFIGPIGVWVY